MMTKKEFWKNEAPQKIKSQILTAVTWGYISAALTVIYAVMVNPLMLIDVVFGLTLTIILHVAKSRICAVMLTIYFIYSKIVQISEGGSKGGYFLAIVIIIAYGASVIGTFKYQKLWKQYKNGSYTPINMQGLNQSNTPNYNQTNMQGYNQSDISNYNQTNSIINEESNIYNNNNEQN